MNFLRLWAYALVAVFMGGLLLCVGLALEPLRPWLMAVLL